MMRTYSSFSLSVGVRDDLIHFPYVQVVTPFVAYAQDELSGLLRLLHTMSIQKSLDLPAPASDSVGLVPVNLNSPNAVPRVADTGNTLELCAL